MNEVTIQVELDGTEFAITFEYSHYYHPAQLFGRPENCYPEEEEFEWVVVGEPSWLNAIESWELSEVDEQIFFDSAIDAIAADKADYGDYLYDQMRDKRIGL